MKNLCIGIFIFLFFSCKPAKEKLSPAEYAQWISSRESGLIKEKKINNVTIRVRYLPPQYLAYREFLDRDQRVSFDTLWNSYKCGINFQVTIEAEKSDATYGDLLYYNVATPEEVRERIQYLNFKVPEFIYIEQKEVSVEPVLSNFDGYDQGGNKMNFQVSFVITEYKCGVFTPPKGELILVFDDPYFDLGTNKFTFDYQSITALPRLVF